MDNSPTLQGQPNRTRRLKRGPASRALAKTSQFNLFSGINELEMQSFLLCDTDEEPGLTMYEFDQCKVRKDT